MLTDVTELARTAEVSSRPPAERVQCLRETIAMLRQLSAQAEERGRALHDLILELNLKSDPEIDDLARRISPVQGLLFSLADVVESVRSGMYAGALNGFDEATLAELERRLEGLSR
jgi:hypothetical protein